MSSGPRVGAVVARPMAAGSVLAMAAAILNGVTAPIVHRAGAGVGAFATAAVLYAGAAIGAGLPRARADEPSLGQAQLGRVAAVALFGAVIAPASFAWGLQRTDALGASLTLNLEAVFTVALAAALYREPIGRRVGLAVALMVAGGVLLAFRAHASGATDALGLLAVTGATLAWAFDNTLTRPLSDFDPPSVVFAKGVGGALLSAAIALLLREAWPTPGALAALLACGVFGFGVSLRLYLRAQRSLGAARTGSLFAISPFVGATVSFAWGDRAQPMLVATAGGVFAIAAYLHATEGHGHLHRHEAVEHEHAHRHDDGHHGHVHNPPVARAHSHVHRHEPTEHEHPHAADLHHRHVHR